MTRGARWPARPIDVVVHFPHSFLSLPPLRSPFLLRFIKCPLNGPIVRPINPFLSTDRPTEGANFVRPVSRSDVVRPPHDRPRSRDRRRRVSSFPHRGSGGHRPRCRKRFPPAKRFIAPAPSLGYFFRSVCMAIDNVVPVRSTTLLYKTRHLCRPREQKMKLA